MTSHGTAKKHSITCQLRVQAFPLKRPFLASDFVIGVRWVQLLGSDPNYSLFSVRIGE